MRFEKAHKTNAFIETIINKPKIFPIKKLVRLIGLEISIYMVFDSNSLLTKVEPINIDITRFAREIKPRPTSRATREGAPYAKLEAINAKNNIKAPNIGVNISNLLLKTSINVYSAMRNI